MSGTPSRYILDEKIQTKWQPFIVFIMSILTGTYRFLFSAQASASLLSSRLNDSLFSTSGFEFIGSSLCENFIGILCQALSSCLSKACMDGAFTTSYGRRFHKQTILCVKLNFLRFVLEHF